MKFLLYLSLGILSAATIYWLLEDLGALTIWILFYGSSGFQLFEGKREG